MYLLSKLKLKKILILLLSFVMVISLAFATACGDTTDDGDGKGDGDDTKTEETLTDYQALKNGDFEFNTKEDTKFPYASSINWSRSTDSDNTSATSSTVSSGIIDTEDVAYGKLKETERPKDGENFINPRTPFYYGLTENAYDKDDKDKQVNPNTAGTKILMIANKTNEDGVGTAQKFKASSNIVIPVEGYARVSIWVKTVNLKSASLPEGEFGAYVRFTNKAGSKEFKDLCLENINTNGNWVKYELYVIGTDLSTTTLTMTVGLGDGNSTFTKNFVEGFAYFDNAQVETFTKSEFNALEKPANKEVINDKDKENIVDSSTLTYVANPTEKTDYSKDLADKATFKKVIDYRYSFGTEVAVTGATPVHPEYINDGGYDLTGAGANTMQAGLKNEIDVTPISEQLANVESEIGNANPYVAYMNFAKPSVAYYISNEITLKQKTYNYLTFYAKVNPENSATKAKVELYDVEADKYYTAFSDMDTSSVEEGNYGGWNFYKMMIYNPTDTDVKYKVKFTFGEDNLKIIEDQWLLQKGYAILADLDTTEIEKDAGKEIYSLISGGNNFKTSLYGKYTSYVEKEDEESTSNDSYPLYTDVQGNFDIAYKPVSSVYGYSFMGDAQKSVTGIINSKYINDDGTYGVNKIAISGLDTFKTLVNEGNTYAQAVVLDNVNAVNTSYRSSKFTVTANTSKKISVKVKVTGDAIANVYLIDISGNPISLEPIQTTLKSTIDKNTLSTVDNWTEVTFYVAAGNEDLTMRVEIWNGDKDLASGSTGAIFFENVKTTDLEEGAFATEKEAFRYDFDLIENYAFESKLHQRPNATLKETVDGEVKESTKTFKPQEIYAGNAIVKFAEFTTIYCDDVIDNTTETDEDTETETDEDAYTVTTDVALQISSIVIALVLLAVMIVVVVRTTIKKKVKKQVKVQSFYDRNSREKAMEKISSKKKEVKLADDEEEYDYEQAQAVEEEITENANEEVIEETATEEVMTLEETQEEVAIEETTEETTEVVEETTTEEKTEE